MTRTARSEGAARPRVALVAHDVRSHGGMELAVAELVSRGATDVDFVVVSSSLDLNLGDQVEWHRVRVPVRPFPLRFLMFYVLAGWRLARLRVDLTLAVGGLVPNRVDVALVHLCHAGLRDATGGRLAPPGLTPARWLNTVLSRALALAAERWTYRPVRTRTLTAVSEGLSAELRRHYPSLPVVLVPNGIDTQHYQPDRQARKAIRAKEQLSDDQFIAVFVGGDWERKGLAVAIESLAAVSCSTPHDVHLWVVGGGEVARFASLAESLGVRGQVTFFGERDDVRPFLCGADVLVSPSAYETFSFACWEAAACELPVIATDVSGVTDLIGADEAGVLVRREAADVASALEMLMAKPSLRASMGQEGRRRALGFSWDESVGRTLDLVATLLDDRRRMPPVQPG